MDEILYKACTSKMEMLNILELQRENHFASLSAEDIASEGFLTCTHSLELIRELNNIAPHIIAVCNNKVIAYLLTMTKVAESKMPLLIPMFNEFRTIVFKGKMISEYNYLIVGQVCVGKGFRGQGVLENCYQSYESFYKDKFDFAITEIANRNKRSINAHKRIGFVEVNRYFSPEGEEWSVVILEWSNMGIKKARK